MSKKYIYIVMLIFLGACSFNKGKSGGFIYIVKKGDTLHKVSSEYNVSVATIKYYNDKYYDDLIIGERLFIPVSSSNQKSAVVKKYKTEKEADGLFYKVQAGDNLYRISMNFGISVNQLKDLNNLSSDMIAVGQKLYIKRYDDRSLQKRKITEAEKSDRIAEEKRSTNKCSKTASQAYYSPNAGDYKTFPKKWQDSFILPTSGRLSSPFGLRNGKFHKGVDISGPPGTEIRATYTGEVSYTGFLRDYGNVIIIDHGNEVVSVYAHNEINLVKKSDKVKSGDVIARLGSTGRSTGPHLHFELRVANKPIDPAQIIAEIRSLKKL